jgi:RHS repeat-associated protein
VTSNLVWLTEAEVYSVPLADTLQRFDAWGNRTSASGTIPTYGYTGREPDATGIVFYRARYYHPGIGRFASRDPMGMVDSVSPYAYVNNSPVNFTDPSGEFLMQAAGAVVGGAGGLLFQAGADLYHGRLSSFSEYAGSVVGGAAGGVAATVCGPACAGAAAGAASNLTTQALRGNGFSGTSLAVDTAFGAVGGKVVGALLPPASKTYLSNQTKGAIGEGLSSIGLKATGQSYTTQVSNGVGKSTFDFQLSSGKFVESKFGTAKLSGPQRAAARQQGDNLEMHAWNYPTLSGLAASGPAAAWGFGSDVSASFQSLDSFASGVSLSPYSGGATIWLNVRQFK